MPHGLDSFETEHTAAPPPGAAGYVERAVAALNQLIVIISSVALLAAAFVLTYSVIVRYFLKFSTDWQDEMSVFLIIGAVFMSAAAIQARRGHVAIEAIVGLLPPRVNRIRQVASISRASCSAGALPGNRGSCSTKPSWTISIRAPRGDRRSGFPIRYDLGRAAWPQLPD